MKNAILILLAAVAVVGCESSKDVSAPVENNVQVTKAGEDPAKAALLPGMTATAKKMGDWGSLPEADKAPFLQYHNNDADQAKKHYETLVQMAKDGDI